MIEDQRNNLIIVEGNPDNGKYIIRRLKFTGDDNGGETESEESGFYIAFRKENDKDWTFSENKHYFDTTGDDYQNELGALITKDSSDKSYSHEVTGGTQKGSESYEVRGRIQEGSQSYEAKGGRQEGSESYEATGGRKEGSESYEATGGRQEGSESYEATGGRQEGSESYEATGGGQEGLESYEATGGRQEGSESVKATGGRQEGSKSVEVTERQEDGTLIDTSSSTCGCGIYKHPAGCHETCTLIMKWKEIPDTDYLEYHIEIGQQQKDFHIGFTKNHAFLVIFLICILRILFSKSNASILGRFRCYNSYKRRICPRPTY